MPETLGNLALLSSTDTLPALQPRDLGEGGFSPDYFEFCTLSVPPLPSKEGITLSDGLSRRPQSPPPGLLVTIHGRRPLMTGSCWWLSRTYLRDDPLMLEAFMGSLSVTTACVKDAG